MSALGLLYGVSADAFSTRVHILIANDLREALIASDDGRTIKLKGSSYSVILSENDARAIMMSPLAFRAGAVGPDNMAFPAMTDPSHALYQRPFVQCDVLYEAAANDEERAYALGCFLHGATDAIAHHYVNYLTDETFTMNPMRSQRQFSFTNVVRHITAESMIQSAAVKLRPMAFTQGQLVHAIPASFVARTYFDEKSALFPYFAGHAKTKLDDAMAKTGKPFYTAAVSAGLAPAEQLTLSPVYIGKADALRGETRKSIEKTIADLQNKNTPDGAKLNVGVGPDGKLGTKDDTTSCASSCASIYAQYFVCVGLLEPRTDASNNPLPPAFDKISDKLGADLREFIAAYLLTVEKISNQFNSPIAAGGMDKLDYTVSDLQMMFDPMIQWSTRLTTIDYQTLSQAVVPGWIIAIQNALQSAGVNVSVPNLLATLLQPIVQPIQDLIQKKVVDEAKLFLEQLTTAYSMLVPSTKSEYDARLKAAAGDGLQGTMLDHFFDSGLYAHAFNIASAAMAQREVVLPDSRTDPVGVGPASFDTSYTPAWMQAGVCAYLRDAIFPFGLDVRGALTVRDASGSYPAKLAEDSAVECHDGAVDKFTKSPTTQTCGLTNLTTLVADSAHRGSLSRGFPPSLHGGMVACRNITVPGLPAPPQSANPDGGPMNPAGGGPGGCGCTSSSSSNGGAAWLLALAALVLLRKRGGR